MDYSLKGHKESDMTEGLCARTHTHTHTHTHTQSTLHMNVRHWAEILNLYL